MQGSQLIQSSNLIKAIERIFGNSEKTGIKGVDRMLTLAKIPGKTQISLTELQAIVNSRRKKRATRSKATQNFYTLIKDGKFPLDLLAELNCWDIFNEEFTLNKQDSAQFRPNEDYAQIITTFWRSGYQVRNIELSPTEVWLIASLGQIDRPCIEYHNIVGEEELNYKLRLIEYAVETRDYPLVNYLLKLGADIHLKNKAGFTPVEIALYFTEDKEALKLMLESEQAKKSPGKFKNLMSKALNHYKSKAVGLEAIAQIIRLLNDKGYTLTPRANKEDRFLLQSILNPSPVPRATAVPLPPPPIRIRNSRMVLSQRRASLSPDFSPLQRPSQTIRDEHASAPVATPIFNNISKNHSRAPALNIGTPSSPGDPH